MSNVGGSSSNLERGRACSNCRRRKLKCDGARPVCNQCRIRPPHSGAPCVPQENLASHQTPTQMQQIIKALRLRIEELERGTGDTTSDVPLWQPYDSDSGTTTPEIDFNFQEPRPEIISKFLDTFLDRFRGSAYFFLEPMRFVTSASLPLPFGHLVRPCPSLLSVVYLWGSVLAATTNDPFAEDTFLLATLQNLPSDVRGFSVHPKLVLETIQAEVLLSLYYLHIALPVQGRYHAAAAASLALSAHLNRLRETQSEPHPRFPLAEQLLLPYPDDISAAERIGAFWGVVLLNNCWVAAHGCPPAIPFGITIDTPWPGGSQAGATVSRFLNGDDRDGQTSVALQVKASILLERIVAFSARPTGQLT
ncbi:hypothetical protein B0H11DRAFT_64778 [Mycena galericulata]|nr:hypothetical protein B0H11DRAFT_64778 [Mycena galericulata]